MAIDALRKAIQISHYLLNFFKGIIVSQVESEGSSFFGFPPYIKIPIIRNYKYISKNC